MRNRLDVVDDYVRNAKKRDAEDAKLREQELNNNKAKEVELLVSQHDQLSQKMSEIIRLGMLDKSEDK
jgi:hypothetical protein